MESSTTHLLRLANRERYALRHRPAELVQVCRMICKGDNGRWQPAYSGILGSLAAGGISNAYYPAADRGAALTFENTLLNIAGAAASNLFEEFLLKKFTTHSHAQTHP